VPEDVVPSLVATRHAIAPSQRGVVALLVVTLALGGLAAGERAAAAADRPTRQQQLRFMWAMAGQESGWDYYARNRTSGAFGKYQIMPFNWPAWADDYLGDRRADQTPYNQEVVAYGKLRDLHRWLGSWKRVAYWWLTGSSERRERKWSSYAKGYVRNIMQLRKRAPADGGRLPARTSSKATAGDWRRSAESQDLRRSAGGRPWPKRGRVRDGQVLRVTAARMAGRDVRWLRVVTVDGRRGWLAQPRTVPARTPTDARRWRDVVDEGDARDRRHVRPEPR
jgi:hypothetical protein